MDEERKKYESLSKDPLIELKTVYQIRPQHRNDEVRELIGNNFDGVLIPHRGRSDESGKLEHVEQQKCLAHVQKNLSEALAKQVGRPRSFRPKELLREALLIWKKNKEDKITAEEYVPRAELVEKQVDSQLRKGRELTNENGATATSVFGRIIRTLKQRGFQIVEGLTALVRVEDFPSLESR
jgi:hypothetical protein